jgi:hypothetical protein
VSSGGVPSGDVPSGGVSSGGVPSGGVPSGGVSSGDASAVINRVSLLTCPKGNNFNLFLIFFKKKQISSALFYMLLRFGF